ncbi:CPBP family intramembrane glutamic endopeptidase [Kocuria aegyptia]|uniref:CAAX prenyl protease 2/Lysostaphin resistance protein A-like domain-containing protein n=1 Tax=Kocuria aegyptia TaxID=330943 RepID=A0ABN2K933_9MICC
MSDAGPIRRRPVLAAFLLLVAAFVLRLNDIFVLRLDESLGEIILSKALGFVLVLAFVSLMRQPFAAIGFHRRDLGTTITIGVLLTLGIYLISYAVEFGLHAVSGDNPAVVLAAIDPKQEVTGGLLFAGWLVFGNVVNALMEEGLFRGVFLPVLMGRFRFWAANAVQALLFGLWHLVWPLKNFIHGEISLGGALAQGGLLLLGSTIYGLIWGYLFYVTGSLWAPIAAHFLANTIQNLVHIESSVGLDVLVSVRGTVASLVGLAALGLIWWLSKRRGFQRLQSWSTADGSAGTRA